MANSLLQWSKKLHGECHHSGFLSEHTGQKIPHNHVRHAVSMKIKTWFFRSQRFWNVCNYSITQSMPALHKCQEFFLSWLDQKWKKKQNKKWPDWIKSKESFEVYGNNMQFYESWLNKVCDLPRRKQTEK